MSPEGQSGPVPGAAGVRSGSGDPLLPAAGADGRAEPQRATRSLLELLLSFSGGLGLLALTLLLLSPLAPPLPDLKAVDREILVDHRYLRPEPLERFLYFTGVLLLPLCLVAAELGVRALRRSRSFQWLTERLETATRWLITPLALLLFFAAGSVEKPQKLQPYTVGGTASLATAALFALGIVALARRAPRGTMPRAPRVLMATLAAALFLGVFLFGVLGPEHVTSTPIFSYSFNAVFSSVVQVHLGRELLVDFANQYGLYPHFIEPVFRLIGLSVYTFTGLMALLNCLSFACLYFFLARETNDELLAFLGLTTLIFFGYVAPRVAQPDLFLQYHPLRMIFPSIAIAGVGRFAHSPTSGRGAALSAVGVAGALWNPDSGLVVLAAVLLLIVYDCLLRRRPSDLPARLAFAITAAAGLVGSFSLLLRVYYGVFPDYTRLFLYPKAFYFYGVMMGPMPRFGLWVPVIGIYALSLLRALGALLNDEDTPRARLHFFLSVFGLGAFAYYQGRSTLGNLIGAGYPAMLLLVLTAEELLRQHSSRRRAADGFAAVSLLALLGYSVPAIASVAPVWIQGIAEKVRITASGDEGEPLRDAKFLQKYLRPGDQVVMRSFNSGLHHLVTRTVDPPGVPGETELLYRKDFEQVRDSMMLSGKTFVVDKNTIDPDEIAELRRLFPTSYDNPFGTLIVFPGR